MGATIKTIKDGPAIIEGIVESPIIVIQHEDKFVSQTDKKVAICRCGKSKLQPYCDGAHKKSNG